MRFEQGVTLLLEVMGEVFVKKVREVRGLGLGKAAETAASCCDGSELWC